MLRLRLGSFFAFLALCSDGSYRCPNRWRHECETVNRSPLNEEYLLSEPSSRNENRSVTNHSAVRRPRRPFRQYGPMSQSNVNQTLGHGGHFHRSKAGRLQIAARPRGGQTADEEGRRHGGERGTLLLNNQRRLGGTTIASVTSRKPRRLAASRFDCPGSRLISKIQRAH